MAAMIVAKSSPRTIQACATSVPGSIEILISASRMAGASFTLSPVMATIGCAGAEPSLPKLVRGGPANTDYAHHPIRALSAARR